jgi:hypothetical protein
VWQHISVVRVVGSVTCGFFFFGLRDVEGKDAMIIQNVMNYLCSDQRQIYCEANEA